MTKKTYEEPEMIVRQYTLLPTNIMTTSYDDGGENDLLDPDEIP